MSGRVDLGIALGLFAALFALGLVLRTPLHTWGDDFAAYLLQAHAIGPDAAVEVSRNGALLAASDGPETPSAAPWGFAILLRIVGETLGWEMVTLKLVGVASLALVGALAFLLARVHLPRGPSLVATATIAFATPVLEQVEVLGSDIPFLALALLALLLMERWMRQPAEPTGRALALIAAAAAVSVAAFTVRSQGLFLFLSAGVVLLVRLIARNGRLRGILLEGLAFGVPVAGLCALYFLALPDGSHTHTKSLDFSLASMTRRAIETIAVARDYAPFAWWPANAIGKAAAAGTLGVVLAACARGLWLARPFACVQLAWCALNLALLVVFKFAGGPRYLFPLLPTLFIFALVGFVDASRHLRSRLPVLAPIRAWRAAGAVWVAAMIGVGLYSVREANPHQLLGPYSPRAQELVAFLEHRTPPTARLGFYKPRALRLLTGRDVLRVSTPARLKTVDYVVVFERREVLRWEPVQPDVSSATDVPTRRVFANGDYTVYEVLHR